MHVANLKTRPLPVEASGTESREPPLVSDLGQGIDLVHELTELATSKEVAQHRGQGLGIDQSTGSKRIDALIVERHALPHHSLRTGQARATNIGKQFTNSSHATISQVIDVVDAHIENGTCIGFCLFLVGFSTLEVSQLLGGSDYILNSGYPNLKWGLKSELEVEHVSTNASQIITL